LGVDRTSRTHSGNDANDPNRDDYDSEFRYDGPPFAALKGLDSGGAVLYCGSYGFTAARSLVDRFPPVLGQAVLCDFITEGHFARHLRAMRELYGARLAVLRGGVRKLSGMLELATESAGLEITHGCLLRSTILLPPPPPHNTALKCERSRNTP
jgi:hypothetical protein